MYDYDYWQFSDRYITRSYLESSYFEDLMETHLDENTDRFNLADNPMHPNFFFRANSMINVCAWKWFCNYQHRRFLIDLVFSDKVGIDFGGAIGPIGGNTKIVDISPYHAKIDDIEDESLDYIFTSHTLEHIINLDETLLELYKKLKKGGIIFITVPCYTCVRWRAGGMNVHKWTFSLEDGIFTRIDKKIKKAGFKINKAEYCWDDSIVIFGEK